MTRVTAEKNSRWLAYEGAGVALLGILLAAFNLRPAITSLGAVLGDVRTGLHLSGFVAGLLTTLPVACFAAFGIFMPRLARRFGPHRVLATAMILLSAGLLARAVTHSGIIFFLTSALALAGVAGTNILLPGLVKTHFPNKVGAMTSAYTMMLALGTAIAAAVTVPAAQLFGGWRGGLALWGGMAALAVGPWLMLARSDRSVLRQETLPFAVKPSRTRLGWALAVYFGSQSISGYVIMGWLPQLYRDAGFSAETAGLVVAGIMGLGILVAWIMPRLASRRVDQRPLVLVLAGFFAAGYLGLLFAPRSAVVLWACFLAIGQGAFPLTLTMINMRSRTASGTVALSAFAQTAGYLFAAVGPMLVGTLYGATHGWLWPILFLLVTVVIQGVAGVVAGKPGFLEDAPGCKEADLEQVVDRLSGSLVHSK